MIRALGPPLAAPLAALLALGGTARGEMPSPLFCVTLELCDTAQSCLPMQGTPHFVMRAVEDTWVMQFSPRGTEFWVFFADSPEAALSNAPEGARIVMVASGSLPDGARVFREHTLERGRLSEHFGRHACRAEGDSTS